VNVLKPHLQTTIATLIAAGKGQREIARITGVDRKTIRGYQAQFAAAQQAKSPTVTTGSEPQIPPPRPPATGAHQLSACAPYQEFVRAQVQLHRNATAIYHTKISSISTDYWPWRPTAK